MIPGVNDSDNDVEQLLQYACGVGNIARVCILPYHKTAAQKFERLGREYRLHDVAPPTQQHLEKIARRFTERGFDVSIGR